MKQTTRFLLAIAILTMPLASVASAQLTTATIVGTITDSSGAALPGATITARNVDTGFSRSIPSGEGGAYRLEFMPIGRYVVEIALDGFKTVSRSGIVLEVTATARVDAKLEVGGFSQKVTVEAAPPPVNTTTAEIGRSIQAESIVSLPLVERNVYTLLDLTPGVQSNNNGVASASTGTSSLVLGYPEQRTLINGGTDGGTGSVNYYLDGGINMTGLRNTGNILPNPDAIQEFRIQTNSYNAEYGRFASGVVNVVTKSGTNEYHGSLFDFLRDGKWAAKDYGSTVAAPPNSRKQFGGVAGGPITQDRTFFFASYSGWRQKSSTLLSSAVVPTALERTGDFSASSNKPVDPATGQTFVCNGVVGVICPDRLDPAAMKIINTYIPLSNTPGNFWQGYVQSPYDSNELLVKVDHQLTNDHRITGSYFTTTGSNTVPAGAGNLPWASQQFNWRQDNVNVSDTWVMSNSQINQAWVTYARNFGGRLNLPQTSLGSLGSAFTIQGAPSLPQITVNGFFTLSNAIGGPTAGGNFYSGRDVYSWMTGNHAIKFGGELSLNKTIQDTLLNNYGVFTFNNSVTKNALADFLVGMPSAVSQDAPVRALWNSWYTALFAQDDFRVLPRVTLNLGVRWDVQTPGSDPLNRVDTYVPGVQSTVNPAAPVGQLFYGDPGVAKEGVPTRWTHVSPRVGVVWDPTGNGRTSIRAAAGMFYGSISGNEWGAMTNFQPFSTRLTFTNTNAKTSATGVPLGATLSNPYNAFVGGDPFPYTGTFTTGGTILGVDKNFQWPYTYQFNASVQRAITNALSVTAAYVGSLGRNLPFAADVNYPVLTPTATSAGANVLSRRPNPAFGPVLLLSSNQTASYNGLQIISDLRLSHQLTLNAFYVLSKSLTSAQLDNNTNQGGAQNFSNLAEDSGRADTDQRHVFNASLNYQPEYFAKSGRLVRNTLDGWMISTIVKLRSGLPFTVSNGVDANLDGNAADRAQLIGDPSLANPTAAEWFNIDAFTQNKVVNGVATDGTSARNLLTGPPYHNVDLALTRSFDVRGRVKATFRAEATNVFNMVSLGQPGATVPAAGTTSSTFGVIRSASPMRRIQLGVRLTF